MTKTGWYNKNKLGNSVKHESHRHSLAAKGIRSALPKGSKCVTICGGISTPNFDMVAKIKEFREPKYASNVRLYANKKNKSIIVVSKEHLGKGWWEHRVGDYVEKSRNPYKYQDILRDYYSGYQNISLFSETSYHSPIQYKNKITKYGTKEGHLQYSSYEPLETYKLEQPLKTELKRKFGKVINKIKLQRWNYIVLNWIPEDKRISLQIEHTTSTPFTVPRDEKKVVYKSKKYKETEKDQAIADFKDYVAKSLKK